MTDIKIKNALIKNVKIVDSDKGYLTAWLDLDYGDGIHELFGGYSLTHFNSHEILSPNVGGLFLCRCMQVTGVSSRTAIAGTMIRVKVENGLACEIGHIVNDEWFNPADEIKALFERLEAFKN